MKGRVVEEMQRAASSGSAVLSRRQALAAFLCRPLNAHILLDGAATEASFVKAASWGCSPRRGKLESQISRLANDLQQKEEIAHQVTVADERLDAEKRVVEGNGDSQEPMTRSVLEALRVSAARHCRHIVSKVFIGQRPLSR